MVGHLALPFAGRAVLDGQAAAWIYGFAQDDARTGPQPWTADGTVAGAGDGSADFAGHSD
jgi:hypothetical protein